jgi:hypothetical protein
LAYLYLKERENEGSGVGDEQQLLFPDIEGGAKNFSKAEEEQVTRINTRL